MNRKFRFYLPYDKVYRTDAYRVLDEHVEERVRHFLRRRHKVSSQGTSQFSRKTIFGKPGVFRLQGRPPALLWRSTSGNTSSTTGEQPLTLSAQTCGLGSTN
jgi:hypothetical protein